VQQKLAFEDELGKEIGTYKKTSFPFSTSKDKHILYGFECSAYASSGMRDDVLFAVNKEGVDFEFAVVHLTWNKEPGVRWPVCEFYRNFDDFKTQVMLEDNKGYQD
jgi:hypothetical protein